MKYLHANSKIILKNKNEAFQLEAQNVILSILAKNSKEEARQSEQKLNKMINEMTEWNGSLKADTYFNYVQIYKETIITTSDMKEYSKIFKYLNETLNIYFKLKNWSKILEVYYYYAKIFYDVKELFNEDFYETMEVIECMEEKMKKNDLEDLDGMIEHMYDGLYVPYAFSKYIS